MDNHHAPSNGSPEPLQHTAVKPLGLPGSLALFGVPAVGFYLLTHLLIPFLRDDRGLHPALSWFIAGSLTFIPLFFLAIALARRNGWRTRAALTDRLRLRRMSGRDWRFALLSSLAIVALMGLIMGLSRWLHLRFGVPEIEAAPAFLRFEPFRGGELWLLAAWLFMFTFNIYGEELLWRGYILPRQEAAFGSRAWAVNAAFWMLFHVAFGVQLMILLLPIILILPWAVQKTRNTNVGILIHALVNGPSFVMVALGVIA